MELQSKNVIVTGGARGIGRELVEKLLAKQAKVCVFDISRPGLEQLHNDYPEIDCVECDLTDHKMVEMCVSGATERIGAIHVLVNNAGFLYSEPLVKLSPTGILKHDPAMWEKTIAANLNSVFYMTSSVVERMIMTRTKGVIVNISSVSACGNAGQSAYSAAKAGVNALTAVWAKELGMMGVRVASVAPGFTNTESTNEVMNQANLQEILKRVPLRRLGKPGEIVDGIIAVIENDFFNGKVFELDGGLVL